MERFTLEIALGNDAMQTSEDVADALRKVAETVLILGLGTDERPESDGIRDLNGNTVGRWAVA